MYLNENQEKLLGVVCEALAGAAERAFKILEKSESGEDIEISSFQIVLDLISKSVSLMVKMGDAKD